MSKLYSITTTQDSDLLSIMKDATTMHECFHSLCVNFLAKF